MIIEQKSHFFRGGKMNPKEDFDHKIGSIIKIAIDSTEIFLELRIDPLPYFYPALVSSDYADYYDEEEGLSEEQFEKRKIKSLEMNKMFQNEKYKDLYKIKVQQNLEYFLRECEYEVEIEYEELISKGVPIHDSSPFKREGTLLDLCILKNDEAILKFLKKKGLYFLRNHKILSRIEQWCKDKNLEKIEKFAKTLKEIAGIKTGPKPPTLFVALNVLNQDFNIRRSVKRIKTKIKKYENEIRNAKTRSDKIISECKDLYWLKSLKKLAKEELGEGNINFVKFIKTSNARYISIKIIEDVNELSNRTVEEIIRTRKKIVEKSEKDGDEFFYGDQKIDKFWIY